MDVMELCVRTDEANGYQVYRVDPAVMYPAMIEYMIEIVGRNGRVPAAERKFFMEAQALFEAGQLAEDVAVAVPLEEGPEVLTPAARAEREAVLELARRWFTRKLKDAARRPVGIHILNDERYRL